MVSGTNRLPKRTRRIILIVCALCVACVCITAVAIAIRQQNSAAGEGGTADMNDAENGISDENGIVLDPDADLNSEDWLTDEDWIANPLTGVELYESLGETLEVVCGNYRGSGFVIERNETEVVIASASHLVMNDTKASVNLSDGSTLTGEVIKLSEQYDIGYIRIDATTISDSQRSLLAAKITANQQYFDQIAEGDYVMLPGRDGTYEEGTVLSTYVFEPDVNAFVMKYAMQAGQGISGGAVYDQNGVCIGMVIAGNEETLVALPVTIVFSEYYIF